MNVEIVGDDDPHRPFPATLLQDQAAIWTTDHRHRRPHAPDQADVFENGQLPVDRVPGLPGVPGKAGNTCVIEDAEAAGGLTDGGRASLPFLFTEEIPDATPRRFGTSAADLTGNLGSQLRKTDMEQAGSVVVPGHGPVIVGRR